MLDALDLRHRRVLIPIALDYEDRCGDAGQELLDIPVTKRRIEPRVVPAPECVIHIVVVAGKASAEIGRLIGLARGSEAFDLDVLDHHVRRHRDDTRKTAPDASGIDECN